MASPISSILQRKLRRAIKDKESYAIGEALAILADVILSVAHDQNSKSELDEAEKGRRAMMLLEIHGITTSMAESVMATASNPPHPQTPKLHLSHLA